MPSKNGFGNSRTPLTKKVQYGANQKNPIKRAGADAMTAVAKGESIVASEARSNPIKRAGADAMTAVAKGESVIAAESRSAMRRKDDEITEHVLFRDNANPSVANSKTTYSNKSGLQISGNGSNSGDVTKSGTSKTGTKKNAWKKSGKKRSAEWIANNPNG